MHIMMKNDDDDDDNYYDGDRNHDDADKDLFKTSLFASAFPQLCLS